MKEGSTHVDPRPRRAAIRIPGAERRRPGPSQVVIGHLVNRRRAPSTRRPFRTAGVLQGRVRSSKPGAEGAAKSILL